MIWKYAEIVAPLYAKHLAEQVLPRVNQDRPNFRELGARIASTRGYQEMVAIIALTMFIALFGWGGAYFGWHDPNGKIQLALVTSFILGAVASYKARG